MANKKTVKPSDKKKTTIKKVVKAKDPEKPLVQQPITPKPTRKTKEKKQPPIVVPEITEKEIVEFDEIIEDQVCEDLIKTDPIIFEPEKEAKPETDQKKEKQSIQVPNPLSPIVNMVDILISSSKGKVKKLTITKLTDCIHLSYPNAVVGYLRKGECCEITVVNAGNQISFCVSVADVYNLP